MLNLRQFKDNKGKIQLPLHIVKNMQNYIKMLGFNSKFYEGNGVINIYVKDDFTVSYYSTKDFACVYIHRRVAFKLFGWKTILRYLSNMRG